METSELKGVDRLMATMDQVKRTARKRTQNQSVISNTWSKKNQSEHRSAQRRANVHKRYQDALMSNYQWENTDVIADYIHNYRDMKLAAMGLYLFGPVGTGKTRALCTILNERIRTGDTSVLYYNAASLLADIRSLIGDNSDVRNTLMMKIKGRWLLILDDLGKNKPSERVDETLYDIINTRYDRWLITLYSSNLPLDDVMEKYDPAIASRIAENTAQIAFTWPDRRIS